MRFLRGYRSGDAEIIGGHNQNYLDAPREDGDPALILAALGDVARARNLSQLARDVGMSR
jgi:probable addiction module antidote protein